MGGFPLAALSVRPPEPPQDPLHQYAQIMSLRDLAQRQQFLPGQLQEQQQAVQAGNIDLQMKQLALKNTQVAQGALSDPNFGSDFENWNKSRGGSATGATPATGQQGAGQSPVPLHPLAQYLAEKRGLSMFGPGGALEISNSLMGATQKFAELAKTQGEVGATALSNQGKQLDNFDNLIEPVLAEKDPAKQAQGLQNIQSEIQAHPELYPQEATQHLGTLNTIQGLQQASNTSKVRQMLVEDATKQAEASTKTLAAGAPTTQQTQNAIRTLASYSAIPPNMRAGLSAEIQNAPNFETLQTIQKRADDTQASFQRSADARQQALALKDVGIQQLVAGKLVTEDQKLGSALDQTAGIRGLLNMSTGGNQAATAAAQTRFAEHEIVEGGVKRMNQVEYQNLAGSLGSYGRRFQSWVDSGFKGEMPPATNAEMKTILDAEDAAANVAHERNVGYIQNRYAAPNLRPGATVPQGGTRQAPPQSQGGAVPTAVQSALSRVGPGIHTLSDGSKWKKDTYGTITKQ